ncbi:MAG: PIN domain-containing protein [Candidatus Lokiarchaeota archaeon]|nr:PIN domain-containing protein [Candidatus Lokiarchaeota archaeon]
MIIVDTTVVIDIWRGRSKVKSVLKPYSDQSIFISAITIAEIYDGLGYTKEKKSEKIYTQIKNQMEKILSEFHIIPLNFQILQESGKLKGYLRAKGITLDLADCIIGTTAKLMNSEKLITRNIRHFQDFGLSIESYEI